VKVLLAYDHPWWSDDVGTFFVLPESPKSKQGASLNSLDDIFNSATMIVSSLCAPNGSSEGTRAPALLAMIGASAGKALEGFERVEVAQALHTYLSKRLKPDGNSADVPVRHAFYSRWARQEHTGGATTTPVTLGNSPKDFSTLASSDYDGHLHFAGEHCEPDHRGSIAGAIVSAQTASDAVLRQLSASSHI
jgi:lysine-specific histone demethylase 1B